MRKRKYRYFCCDFETTVYENQDFTEVWASAIVELYTEDVKIFHSLRETFDYLISLKSNLILYYHNLKFDGSFWLAFLLQYLKYKQAYWSLSEKEYDIEWRDEKDMENNSFKYSISDRGQWYSIIIKTHGIFIEIRDSLKLLPFSVETIGKSFGTKHQKLDMNYKGFRYAGCEITEKEKEYIANDVLVPKEALEIMFSEGHDKLTIGSCCLSEYKSICKKSLNPIMREYDELFPNVADITLTSTPFKESNVDEWIRKSYRGGWCYVVKGKEGKIYTNGITADVNSLYPSVMHSVSGNRYPVGYPTFWSGDYIPEEATKENRYFFVRIKTRFYIKKDKLPFIQIKSSFLYKGTECLETSDVYDSKTGNYLTHWTDFDGMLHDTRVEMTLTMTDYKLLKDHYNLVDFEVLGGCWFYSQIGIFDEYIDKYRKIKQESKGAKRTLAKLFLNNLYGKMASNTDSSFKVAFEKEDGSLGFMPVTEKDKKPGYIPVGSAITSYARDFTIRTAQANYHGVDNPGFIYADTDSIHCDLSADELVDVPVSETEFCKWKLEASWDLAIFTRQKTYIEHVVGENLEPIEPWYNIKCAGMPDRCKKLFELSLNGTANIKGYVEAKTGDFKQWNIEQSEFLFYNELPIVRTLKDFTFGLKVPGKLMPKRIKGGIVLMDSTYEMR